MGKELRRLAALLTALTLWILPAAAQPILAAADMRPATSLDGAWH